MKSTGLRRSQAQEKRLAEKHGGQVSAASGAFWSRKGDVRSDRMLIEAKTTANKSFSVTRVVMDKIEKEAILDGRMPVLAVEIAGRNYVVLTEDDFDELLEGAWLNGG